MKILVATDAMQGQRPGDFCTAERGEPVYFGATCSQPDPQSEDGTCGCGSTFTGLGTGKLTTTAVVAEVPDMTVESLARLIGGWLASSGWCDLYRPGRQFAVESRRDAAALAAVALRFPAGTVVERRISGVTARALAGAA